MDRELKMKRIIIVMSALLICTCAAADVKKMSYALKTDRGVYQTLKKNAIIVGDTSEYAAFDTPLDVQDYIKQRKIAVLNRKDLTAEEDIAAFYVEHYARLQEIAIPFEAGLTLKTNHPHPISYGGTLYECIQGHTTQADWTPDIVPALFSEIQPPGASGYPDWVQPTGAQDAYAVGDRVVHEGKVWESTIPANTTVPGQNLAHGYWIEI
jgi:hypothetical protein